MKKIVLPALLVVVILLVACDGNMSTGNKTISPPTWVQGTYRNTTADLTVTVTADNFVIDMPSMTYNFKQSVSIGAYSVTETDEIVSGVKRYNFMLSANGQTAGGYGIAYDVLGNYYKLEITSFATSKFDVVKTE